tara:strand:- start:178 stop:291 length:114 start_codon:yes stop_codon:yes gene_type:complete
MKIEITSAVPGGNETMITKKLPSRKVPKMMMGLMLIR